MEDTLLFIRFKNGSEDAYKQLFLRYYAPLLAFASRFLSKTEAEEVVQDLMLYLWEKRGDLLIESSLKSYLFAATKNRCFHVIEKRNIHERIHANIYDKLKNELEDPDYYMLGELSEKINLAIGQLPASYKQTFELSRFSDLTNVEIAKELGVSVKTVEYRISQALKILRKDLKDYL